MLAKEDMRKRPLAKNCDLFTIRKFKTACKNDWFNDFDGFGLWSDGTYEYGSPWEDAVYPSDILKGKIRKEFTHVVWFNK